MLHATEKINENFYPEDVQIQLERSKKVDDEMKTLLAHHQMCQESLNELKSLIYTVWSSRLENITNDIREGGLS